MFFFFFKQKTAYELRISDWSSDVCSSDLFTDTLPSCFCGPYGPVTGLGMKHSGWVCGLAQVPLPKSIAFDRVTSECSYTRPTPTENRSLRSSEAASVRRSEEHTSELQSLMRSSYAVFCLKKKKRHTRYKHT